ncbi:cytochrome-c peroxidase [Shewanella fidelis]|uniref:Cytochrome-c peroxidase n=1 Tax=Shewanella fidelis TaxID=173509 RepID=A0AAW8NPY4_9GAMM|nr:cytochrome c peroxidase [Shewanella fidelis]MDR8525269.1 cytochrome-c peroxidase [Shewanella fidelis]MDW4814082.1 cytochrome-c peroxidase [Shewanella fidelis]MDW4818258.1 cytochrome-c peroxidase [Shewanella fidelis]MDW4822371.1 cytochrome-c peroxidase [Shewanella fidelis]MDW4826509.1 cytochrome-c peroxidase [Shewanella fidelis]
MLFRLRWSLVAIVVIAFSSYLYLTVTKVEPSSSKMDSSLSSTQSKPLSSHSFSVSAIPISSINPEQKPLLKLGMQLFLDPRLSSSGKVSCESCHHINGNGAELIAVSTGVNGQGNRNSPTVFNVAFNTRFFWDGRANSLYEQIDGPIHNPLEMDTSWQDIIVKLNDEPRYTKAFNSIYEVGITEATIKHALVSFMEQLNTPGSAFDNYLNGDEQALSATALNGWHKFRSLGCIYCHQGQNIGGNLFQKFGSVHAVTEAKGDLGRYSITKQSADKHVFRVPSLRNVANTPPYFHDGRTASLEEAVIVMAKVQLGKELEPTTLIELVAFLNSLSAPVPEVIEELSQ